MLKAGELWCSFSFILTGKGRSFRSVVIHVAQYWTISNSSSFALTKTVIGVSILKGRKKKIGKNCLNSSRKKIQNIEMIEKTFSLNKSVRLLSKDLLSYNEYT